MKTLTFSIFLLFLIPASHGQYFTPQDRSPMDMAYFPDNFAHDRKAGEKAFIRVLYSRPQKKGRDLFGSLVPFGKVWRTGANEAPEIKLYQDIIFEGNTVGAGTYSLFTIPGEDNWEIIINKDLDYWGAYSYNPNNDVLRVKASTEETDQHVEHFTIQFEATGENSGKMMMAWGNTIVTLPFKY